MWHRHSGGHNSLYCFAHPTVNMEVAKHYRSVFETSGNVWLFALYCVLRQKQTEKAKHCRVFCFAMKVAKHYSSVLETCQDFGSFFCISKDSSRSFLIKTAMLSIATIMCRNDELS